MQAGLFVSKPAYPEPYGGRGGANAAKIFPPPLAWVSASTCIRVTLEVRGNYPQAATIKLTRLLLLNIRL